MGYRVEGVNDPPHGYRSVKSGVNDEPLDTFGDSPPLKLCMILLLYNTVAHEVKII